MSQRVFAQALLNPDLAVPEGLIDGLGRPAGRRFSVYRNNVAGSLTEALEQSFPVLVKLLGEAFFKAMAGVFLRQHPPKSRMMMQYGEAMPAFLAGFPPLAHLPYLADVARLEQALREAYHTADVTPLSPEVLGAVPPDRFMASRLVLAPALRLVASAYPVLAIWRANTQEGAPPPIMQPEAALVLRPEYDPEPHLLPPGGADFVAALLAGETVGDALDKAGGEFDIGTMLALLIGGRAITGLDEETL